MQSVKTNYNSNYGYPCEYCEGTVRPKKVEQEAFKHKDGIHHSSDYSTCRCWQWLSQFFSQDLVN